MNFVSVKAEGYRVVAFSDLHGTITKEITDWFMSHPTEILLFAGDLQYNHIDDGKLFLKWVASLPYTHKILIFGNHDSKHASILKEAILYKNMHFLMNTHIIVAGLKIFGSPYSLNFGNWDFMTDEDGLNEIYNKIEPDTDIILSHSPPNGILDKTIRWGVNAGSESLAYKISQMPKLKACVFGHIHEGYGVWWNENGTQFINASIMNVDYESVNLPIIVL